MPNPKPKTPSTIWKKGQTGNTKGSSARARELGAIGRLGHAQVAEIGSLILEGGFDTVDAMAKGKVKCTVLQRWTCALIIKSMIKGDGATYERLMNRIVGRVPEKIELTGKDGESIQVQSVDAMKAQLAAIRKANEEMGDD